MSGESGTGMDEEAIETPVAVMLRRGGESYNHVGARADLLLTVRSVGIAGAYERFVGVFKRNAAREV